MHVIFGWVITTSVASRKVNVPLLGGVFRQSCRLTAFTGLLWQAMRLGPAPAAGARSATTNTHRCRQPGKGSAPLAVRTLTALSHLQRQARRPQVQAVPQLTSVPQLQAVQRWMRWAGGLAVATYTASTASLAPPVACRRRRRTNAWLSRSPRWNTQHRPPRKPRKQRPRARSPSLRSAPKRR